MKLKTLLTIAAISILFTSCIQKAFFVNPGYGNAMPYHTLPLNNDSAKNRLYLNGSFMAGSANYNYSDEQFALNANIYNVSIFSNFKTWYGGGITLGIYDVKRQEDYPDSTYLINNFAGNKFYGSLNGNAGIAYSLQLGNVEWRILGVELTVQQEFGNFLKFRQKLADAKIPADGNVTDAFLLTAGVSTEICIKIPNGSFNIFQQYNVLTGSNYKYSIDDYNYYADVLKTKRYDYFSSTYAATIKNMTYYLQTNLQPFWKQDDNGPEMENIQVGINYRFPLKKRK